VCLFWKSARLTVLDGLTALYATALVSIILTPAAISRQPKPFATTLAELGADRS